MRYGRFVAASAQLWAIDAGGELAIRYRWRRPDHGQRHSMPNERQGVRQVLLGIRYREHRGRPVMLAGIGAGRGGCS